MDSPLGFLENKTILVIGAAGFLAKILIEKILRTQPDVKKIYLLLRAKDEESANIRLQNEVLGIDLFRVLKKKLGADFNHFIGKKVVMVPGDTACEDLKIQDSVKQQLWKDLDVIVNLAANTRFRERYDVSLNVNTIGAKNVLDFAKKCTNVQVLVHVSTAYVSGEKDGLISEKPFSIGDTLNGQNGLNIEEEKRIVEETLSRLCLEKATDDFIKSTMKNLGEKRAKKYGWQNVYVFTKALGEMTITEHKGDLSVVIIRPTIVTATFKEPFPGWTEGIRTMDSFAAGYANGAIVATVCDPETILDLIPGDMVINTIIVAMTTQANDETGNAKIYHVGSSMRNPVKISVITEKICQYFTKNPWTNNDGEAIKVSRPKVYTSVTRFNRYLTLRYGLPVKGLGVVNKAFCHLFNGLYSNLNKKINLVRRVCEIYRPYMFSKAIYDDTNTERLRVEAREILGDLETDVFYFDPKAINWEDYILDTHLPGLVNYVLK